MTPAVLFAFASASLLGAGVVTAQFGLRTVEPLSGAAISIPSFTLLFLLASPLLLAGEPVVWRALPIFAAIGLVFPAMLTLLTFASNRALGPVVTSTLGNLAPLFAVALAVILLHEPLRALQLGGLVIAVIGAVIITVTRPRDFGDWRSWALLLPLGSALLRGVVPPIVKLGLEIWPSPLWACLIGYVMSSLVVLTVERVRNGSFIADAPWRGRFWFAVTGICNGLSRTDPVCRLAQRPDHAGRTRRRDLSTRHRALERDHAAPCADHAAHRRRHGADGCRCGAGAGRLSLRNRQHTIASRAAVQAAALPATIDRRRRIHLRRPRTFPALLASRAADPDCCRWRRRSASVSAASPMRWCCRTCATRWPGPIPRPAS